MVDALYPKPEFITIALIICPFSTIGLTIAPDPDPVSLISKSGVEKYPSPLPTTATSSILPFTIIGLIVAFLPVRMLTSGFIWWFKIVDP